MANESNVAHNHEQAIRNTGVGKNKFFCNGYFLSAFTRLKTRIK